MVFTRTMSARRLRLLTDLPEDLALFCLEHVQDVRDRASVCLALPRFGLTAMRTLDAYRGPLMTIAVWLATVPGAVIDEELLRKYALDTRATSAGCEILTVWANGTCGICVGPHPVDPRFFGWWLIDNAGVSATVLRYQVEDSIRYYEGDEDAERLVKVVNLKTGRVVHYAGDKGVERRTSVWRRPTRAVRYYGYHFVNDSWKCGYYTPDSKGVTTYFEGEKGAERVVRYIDHDKGVVNHYEGEKGQERGVRQVFELSGQEYHFEGDKGAERKVRVAFPNGTTEHFEGDKGEERLVRVVYSNGGTDYYDGRKGAERRCRRVRADGGEGPRADPPRSFKQLSIDFSRCA